VIWGSLVPTGSLNSGAWPSQTWQLDERKMCRKKFRVGKHIISCIFPSTSWIHWNLGRSARNWDFAMMSRKAQDSRGMVVENSSIFLDWQSHLLRWGRCFHACAFRWSPPSRQRFGIGRSSDCRDAVIGRTWKFHPMVLWLAPSHHNGAMEPLSRPLMVVRIGIITKVSTITRLKLGSVEGLILLAYWFYHN